MSAHVERLTAEQCQTAAEEYKAAADKGAKRAIVDKYGVDAGRLWDWAHRGPPQGGYQSKKGGYRRGLPPEEQARRDAIAAEYQSAADKPAVAKKHGVPLKTLYWWAQDYRRRNGIKVRGPHKKKAAAAAAKNGAPKADRLVAVANKALARANDRTTGTPGSLVRQFLRTMRDMGWPIAAIKVDAETDEAKVTYQTQETVKL